MIERDSHYIGGQWWPASGTERFDVTDAATEEVIGTVVAGTAQDADHAVAAARSAFEAWAATSPAERAGYLKRAAEELQLRQTEIAALITTRLRIVAADFTPSAEKIWTNGLPSPPTPVHGLIDISTTIVST